MKGAIIYYSNTGNTKLACEYLKNNMKYIEFDLYDMKRNKGVNLTEFDVLGFAFFTDAWQPPALFIQYIESLQGIEGKYAFSLNTYGCISGKTAQTMCNALKQKKLKVIATYSLHTPENYPPMIVAGNGFENSPSDKEKLEFDSFITMLDKKLNKIKLGDVAKEEKVRIGLINSLLPSNPNAFTRILTGKFFIEVDKEKCIKCGICERECPAYAISIDKFVKVNNNLCQKCWSCYNHCPRKAIICGKYRGNGQYAKPTKELVEKLSSNYYTNNESY